MYSLKLRNAFTLIELMIVIVIIGILAAIAVPTYRTYILKSKMAEAYNVIDSQGKMEIALYGEHGEFIPFDWNGSTGLQSVMKAADLPNSPYALFGYPVAPGTDLYFGYLSLAGKFDASGTAVTNTSFFSPPALTVPIGFNSIGTHVSARYEGTGSRCNPTVTVGTLGITAQPDYDWAVISACADFKADQNECTMIVRTLEATNKNPQYRSGFIVFSEGE